MEKELNDKDKELFDEFVDGVSRPNEFLKACDQ